MALVSMSSDDDQHDFYTHALSLYKRPNFSDFFRYFVVPILYRSYSISVVRRCVNHAALFLRNNTFRDMSDALHRENHAAITDMWYPRGIRVDKPQWEYKLAMGYWEVTKDDEDLRTVAKRLSQLNEAYINSELRAVRKLYPSKFQRMRRAVRDCQEKRSRPTSI